MKRLARMVRRGPTVDVPLRQQPEKVPPHAITTVWEAIAAHQARVDEVLPSGNPAQIKHLYLELGDLLEEIVADDAKAAPVLSFPETGPVVAALASSFGGTVLDVGCGPSPIFSILLGSDRSRSIVSLDISPGIVRIAKARADASGIRFLGVVGDAEGLPFRDGAFGGAVCEDTIEHLPDDRLGLRELARVIRSGGGLVLATPNRRRLDVIRQRMRDLSRGRRRHASAYYAASSHLREYTWRDLEELTAEAFRLRARETVGWSGGWKALIATRLVKAWPLQAFSRVIVLLLEKRAEETYRRR